MLYLGCGCVGSKGERAARARLGQDTRTTLASPISAPQDPLRIPDATIELLLHLPAGAQRKD